MWSRMAINSAEKKKYGVATAGADLGFIEKGSLKRPPKAGVSIGGSEGSEIRFPAV